ncbi:MAG: TonB-dependent receptor domain-containing protein [Muribaculaceae bacterium]
MTRIFIAFALLTALFAACFSASADVLRGRIVDAESKQPIEGASVFITSKNGSTTWSNGHTTDSLGTFVGHANFLETSLEIQALGYYDKKVRRACFEGNDTIDIGDIAMRPSELMLKELQVKGTAKRFTMRGDTIVFNPQAFKLEEGDRLDALIKKLPGVRLENDGSLSWNGKPIRLRMNGNKAMDSGLIGQLPVEAVKEIKRYDKDSEFTARTGVKDGEEEQVLDIVIKPGWLDKWYGSLNASATTQGHYTAHLRTNRLSDSNPLLVFVRVSHFNSMFEPYGFNGILGDMGADLRQQMGAFGYQHRWQPAFEGWKEKNEFSAVADLNHYDERQGQTSMNEYFLDNQSSSVSVNKSKAYNHNLSMPLDLALNLNLSPNDVLFAQTKVTYNKTRSRQGSEQTTSVVDSDEDVNRSNTLSHSLTDAVNTNSTVQYKHFHGKNSYKITAQLNYRNSDKENLSNSQYTYFTDGNTVTDNQFTKSASHLLNTSIAAKASNALGKSVLLNSGYSLNFKNEYSNNSVTRNDAYDAANSLRSDDNTTTNTFRLSSTINVRRLTISPEMGIDFKHQRLEYRRGVLDTTATRNAVLPSPSLTLQWKPSRNHTIRLNTNYTQSLPQFVSTMAYVDDLNPLFITEGNPNLRRSGMLSAGINHVAVIPNHEQVLTLSLTFTKEYDPIGSVNHYNSLTGVYRSRSENLRGGNSFAAMADHSITLFEVLQLGSRISYNNTCTYGVLTMVDDATQRTFASRRLHQVVYNPSLTLTFEKLKLTGNGTFTFNHNIYSEAQEQSLNTFKYTAQITAEFKTGIFTFALNPNLNGQSGYRYRKFNRHIFALDAWANAKLLKKKLTVGVKADDIFNKKRVFLTNESSTSRSDTTVDFLHNYVQFFVTYDFDAK